MTVAAEYRRGKRHDRLVEKAAEKGLDLTAISKKGPGSILCPQATKAGRSLGAEEKL